LEKSLFKRREKSGGGGGGGGGGDAGKKNRKKSHKRKRRHSSARVTIRKKNGMLKKKSCFPLGKQKNRNTSEGKKTQKGNDCLHSLRRRERLSGSLGEKNRAVEERQTMSSAKEKTRKQLVVGKKKGMC